MGKTLPDHPDQSIALHAPELYAAEVETGVLSGLDSIGEAEIAAYREHGYLVIHDAFTPEEVEAAKQGLLHLIGGGDPDFTNLEVEPAAKETWQALPAAQKPDAVRKLMDFTRFDGRLNAMARKPALLAVMERLLGAQPVLFQDMALLKPPKWGREKPWHQDHAYFDLPLSVKLVGVWIALDPATPENGCMHVLPGGHRDGPLPHFNVRDWQLCDSLVEGKRAASIPLPAGGCLLFDGLLPHGTPHNHSADRRRALQFHYIPPEVPRVSKEERLAAFGGAERKVSC